MSERAEGIEWMREFIARTSETRRTRDEELRRRAAADSISASLRFPSIPSAALFLLSSVLSSPASLARSIVYYFVSIETGSG